MQKMAPKRRATVPALCDRLRQGSRWTYNGTPIARSISGRCGEARAGEWRWWRPGPPGCTCGSWSPRLAWPPTRPTRASCGSRRSPPSSTSPRSPTRPRAGTGSTNPADWVAYERAQFSAALTRISRLLDGTITPHAMKYPDDKWARFVLAQAIGRRRRVPGWPGCIACVDVDERLAGEGAGPSVVGSGLAAGAGRRSGSRRYISSISPVGSGSDRTRPTMAGAGSGEVSAWSGSRARRASSSSAATCRTRLSLVRM